jgi:hypothetical protein
MHHRGQHPGDEERFAPGVTARLRQAVFELSWLWSRGYADESTLKLVGDRHALDARQRLAVRRCACTDEALAARSARRAPRAAVRGAPLLIDAFNLVLSIEAALGGAVLLLGRDGCIRDMAGVHGSYRKVAETRPALEVLARTLASLGAGPCRWFLDKPVSNSGRLRALILATARLHGFDWEAELVPDPDAELQRDAAAALVVSSDHVILDHCGGWFPLATEAVAQLPAAPVRLLDLRPPVEA